MSLSEWGVDLSYYLTTVDLMLSVVSDARGQNGRGGGDAGF